MIINIPLQIDEAKMEEVLQKDYEDKVVNEIIKYIKAVLVKSAPYSYRGTEDKVSDGLRVLIESRIDEFLNDHEQEILYGAADILATKLARSKKGKAILDGVCADAERREEGDER